MTWEKEMTVPVTWETGEENHINSKQGRNQKGQVTSHSKLWFSCCVGRVVVVVLFVYVLANYPISLPW